MASASNPGIVRCESTIWKNRDATRLSNGLVELTVLTGGGHLAEFRFLPQNRQSSPNVFWEAPWPTADPSDSHLRELAEEYGSPAIGRFLAGYTGHALCMDRFGEPSFDQVAAGLTLHGEAAVASWNEAASADLSKPTHRWNVRLPIAQLNFERKIRLGNHESVVYVEENVCNERAVDHHCQWVQHATFGPPFLESETSTVIASAMLGATSPFDYEGRSLLAAHREFFWPHAPRKGREDEPVDLRHPFSSKGSGFLAGVQMDMERQIEYILAVNWKLHLAVGYCFRRQDFPWMAIWEENCARDASPWNGRTQARGMEFGTTPLPSGPGDPLDEQKLFGMSTHCVIPAHRCKSAKYVIFLAEIPPESDAVEKIEADRDAIHFYGAQGNIQHSIPAVGCEEFLVPDKKQA